MATKWRYATVPASQRLDMLKSGNKELYDEEIARTQEAIANRLAAGLDVSAQMDWADSVAYNYNLSNAKNMGISEDDVARTGYAQKLFGDIKVTGPDGKESTVGSPANLSTKNYKEDPSVLNSQNIAGTISKSYMAAINRQASLLNNSYQQYLKQLDAQYKKYEDEARKQYNNALRISEEASVNGNEGDKLNLTEKLRLQENFNNTLAEYRSQKTAAQNQAKSEIDQKIYNMYISALSGISDEYYRYNSLLNDKELAEYQKSRDALTDNKWYAEFSAAIKQADKENEQWQKEYDMQKIENNRDYSLSQSRIAADNQKLYTDFYKWYNEFLGNKEHQELKNDQWEREFEYQKQTDAQKAAQGNDGSKLSGDGYEYFGDSYNYALDYARMLASGKGGRKYTDEELAKWVGELDLSEKEKKEIAKIIGVTLA